VADSEYRLICAVSDLYDIYTRVNPRGPYRHTLFHDPAQTTADWPAQIMDQAGELEELIRGISCLLANGMGRPALPVITALWQRIIRLERQLAGQSWQMPAYYRYIQREMQQTPAEPTTAAYYLFGEVLAIYIDILCETQPTKLADIQERVSALRRVIAQKGEISSDSSA